MFDLHAMVPLVSALPGARTAFYLFLTHAKLQSTTSSDMTFDFYSCNFYVCGRRGKKFEYEHVISNYNFPNDHDRFGTQGGTFPPPRFLEGGEQIVVSGPEEPLEEIR